MRIDELRGSRAGELVKLDWSPVTLDAGGRTIGGVTYNVYRSASTPYFTPQTPYSAGLTSPTFTDPDGGVVGNAAQSTYYVVRAVSSGLVSDPSNYSGVFCFALVPGAP